MNNELQKARAHPVLETISGLTAGIATTLTAHPLDLIKTRLQSKYHSPRKSALSRLTRTYSSQSICRDDIWQLDPNCAADLLQ